MKIPFSSPCMDDEVKLEVQSVLESGSITAGFKVLEWERWVAEQTEVSHVNKMLLTGFADNAQTTKSNIKRGWTKVRQEGKSVNRQKIVHK